MAVAIIDGQRPEPCRRGLARRRGRCNGRRGGAGADRSIGDEGETLASCRAAPRRSAPASPPYRDRRRGCPNRARPSSAPQRHRAEQPIAVEHQPRPSQSPAMAAMAMAMARSISRRKACLGPVSRVSSAADKRFAPNGTACGSPPAIEAAPSARRSAIDRVADGARIGADDAVDGRIAEAHDRQSRFAGSTNQEWP